MLPFDGIISGVTLSNTYKSYASALVKFDASLVLYTSVFSILPKALSKNTFCSVTIRTLFTFFFPTTWL